MCSPITTFRTARRSDQSRTAASHRASAGRIARMPTATATSGNRSWVQFTSRASVARAASAATTEIIGGSVFTTRTVLRSASSNSRHSALR